jgi:hypothetical protein
MTETAHILLASAAPTIAVVVGFVLHMWSDRRAHRKIDAQLRILLNGHELKMLEELDEVKRLADVARR